MSFQRGLDQRRQVTSWPTIPIPAIYESSGKFNAESAAAVAVIGFTGDRLAVFVDGEGHFDAAGFHQIEYVADIGAPEIDRAQAVLDARMRRSG